MLSSLVNEFWQRIQIQEKNVFEGWGGVGVEKGKPVKLWTLREWYRIQIQDFTFLFMWGGGGGGGGQGEVLARK